MCASAAESAQWWEHFFQEVYVSQDGPRRTRHFMFRLLACLPVVDRRYLACERLRVAHVGCGFGDGVDVLAGALQRAQVVGLECSPTAIGQAQRFFPKLEFRLTENRTVGGEFDALLVTDRLEYHAAPLGLVAAQLRGCHRLYVALVPYKEDSLAAGHLSRFCEETFPQHIGDFQRLECKVVETDKQYGAGPRLLVVYGSPSYVQQRGRYAELLEPLDELQERFDELHAWTESLNDRCNEKTLQIQELEARLHSITASRGWRLLQGLRRLRYLLFPHGSRRERLGKWCMHKQRRFRHHARQGPGAVLRAFGGTLRRGLSGAGAKPSTTAALAPLDTVGATEQAESVLQVPGLVSVILPAYNQSGLLRESIESVLAQTYEAFELIVVNDGSTDGIEAVLDEYTSHPKVRLLTQANQKLPKALSNGFEFARGQFWTWTSADNLMEPEQLEKQVAFLRAHPDVALVYCDYLAIDDQGQLLRDPNFRPHNRRTPDSPEVHLPRATAPLNTVEDNFVGACFMYRSWVGRLVGEYAPYMGIEDYDYWMRLNLLFKLEHIDTDQPLYRYRVHDNTLCARAVEHSIYQRVRRLMAHERERSAYFKRPWTVYADEPTEAWLAQTDTGSHTVRRLTSDKLVAENGEKILLLVRADTLPILAERSLNADCCVAAWLDQDRLAPYRYASAVQRAADICFAGDAPATSRLGLFTRCAFQVPPGPSLFGLALAFGNNHLFFRQTTPAADRARTLPHVYQPADRRLRVLLQVDNFLQGGFEQVVLDVAAVLDPEQFDVSILVLGQEGAARAKARDAGLKVLRLPPGERDDAYRRLLREQQIDLVNAHYSVFGAALAAEQQVPFIQTIHSTYVWLTDRQIAEHRQADAHTTAYLCVSSAAASYADLRLGLSVDKMLIVPNGIDAQAMDAARERLDRAAERERLGYEPADFVFLLTASIYPPKGQLLLVQALAKAVRDNPHIKVALLGRAMDEGYTQAVREAVQRLGVAHAVNFLGYHSSAAKFYYLCDAFVLPSFCEGWSLSLAEALYAGLPVIASDVGSAPDLLTRTGGHLLPSPSGSIAELDLNRLYRSLDAKHPEFIDELAEALSTVAADPRPPQLSDPLRRSLDRRHAYRAYAQVFEWVAAGGVPAAGRPWIWELHDAHGRVSQARS